MRIIAFTDVHYAAGLTTCGTRTCYQSLDKLRRIARAAGHADAFINLGDLVNDTGDDAANALNIDAALQALGELGAPCHSLTGNHDMEVAPRVRFTGSESDWRAFELGGLEWLALDCNYTHAGERCAGRGFDWEDAALPNAELNWLRGKLAQPGAPVVILSHHPLSGDSSDPHVIRNQAELAGILAGSKRPVRMIIQGHYHPGARREICGIPSIILPAVCEGDGCPFAVLSIEDGHIALDMAKA